MAKELTDLEILQIRAIAREEAAIEAKRVADELRMAALVNGDAQLHKAMQQSELNSSNFWREIWSKIIITTAATGTGSIVLFLFYAVLSAIKTEFKK